MSVTFKPLAPKVTAARIVAPRRGCTATVPAEHRAPSWRLDLRLGAGGSICARPWRQTRLGGHVLIGPHAHLNGARVGDGCFLATGAALFPGCVAGAGSEVRIHGVVQVNTILRPGTTIPIGWVAVGDPAKIYPPDQHEQIWVIQESLDFPGTVYGVTRDTPAAERMSRQANWFAAHLADRLIHEGHHEQDD